MKKLLILGLILCSTYARSQAVIEHVYSHQTCQYNLLSPTWNLTTYGWVYAMKPYNTYDQISIYNSNHTLLKTIQLQMPAGTTYVTISNISDKLFNSDNKIEVLYGYMTYTTPIVIKMVLQNEDGQVLQEFPGIMGGYVYQINGDFKMLAGSSTDSNTYVYNLPGTVLDLPDIKNESSFYVSVFPNPCTSFLNIEYPLTSSFLQSTLKVLTTTGKELKNIPLPSGGHIQLKVEDLAPGEYLYKIETNKEVLTIGKFVVSR